VGCICIEKQKVVWIPKLRKNSWEAVASVLNELELFSPVDGCLFVAEL
jgi:hypothetical protein